jgi:hypothetical protein
MAFVIRFAFVFLVPPSRFGARGPSAFPFQASAAPHARAEGEAALVMKARGGAGAEWRRRSWNSAGLLWSGRVRRDGRERASADKPGAGRGDRRDGAQTREPAAAAMRETRRECIGAAQHAEQMDNALDERAPAPQRMAERGAGRHV